MAFQPITDHIPGGTVQGSNGQLDADFTVTDVHSTAQFVLGHRVRAYDTTTLCWAEFVYAKGVATVTAGDAYIIKHGDNACILVDDGTAGAEIGGLVGFAMAAIVASSYGWFQVWGRATANVAASFAANGLIYATTTAGTVDDAAGGGQILKARSESAIGTPAASQAYIDIFYPFIGGTTAGLA